MDESLAYFYHKERGLSLRIVRLFNTVGPRQIGDYGMVLPRFVDAAISGKPILVHGNGNQIRCFCHVDDVVRALLLIMDDPKAIGQVFNVGNDTQTSIIALAQLVKKITKSDSIISNVPYQDIYPNGFEDMLCRVPDISKIRNFFGWSPEITLEQIVKDIVDFQANKF
jgi:UDP-glucose 4-epimerase